MADADATRRALPLILIRGFGGVGVEDEKRIAYQGFNDGTVYPHKRGENYIYEGLILRFMKSDWQYQDATNVVGYYSNVMESTVDPPPDLKPLEKFLSGDRIVIDAAMALNLIRSKADPCRTLWVFRYYDLDDRKFETYGKALVRLISFIQALAQVKKIPPPKVNILAHSMGGLLVREAVQITYPRDRKNAADYINKIVTLGTPHKGISFQFLRDWIKLDAEQELEHFNPDFQEDKHPAKKGSKAKPKKNQAAYKYFDKHFPVDRLLTVVGTNYRTYSVAVSSWLNRLFSVAGEGGPTYNRSDGLVKQSSAELPGAHRTFVHKCHGGNDSLVTSREAYEIATRFFFGNIRARLSLVTAKVERGGDFFGKSEFFFGVSLKPRKVDFDLFHQSPEAENCYGPFHKQDLSDKKVDFNWARPKTRLIWEGFLDASKLVPDEARGNIVDMVLRADFYVGERDTLGVGFSDNVIFRKQYYLRAVLDQALTLYCHTGEEFMKPGYQPRVKDRMPSIPRGWTFDVSGTGFSATLALELDYVPLDGAPIPLRNHLAAKGDASELIGGATGMPVTPDAVG